MAIFNCPECQGTVSDKAPACPHCGAPSPVPAGSAKDDTAAAKAPAPEPSKTAQLWTAVILASIIGGCVAMFNGMKAPKSAQAQSEPAKFTASDARSLCQLQIKQMSRDAEKAKIPNIPAAENAESFSFVWSNRTQLVRLRNGLGIEVGVPAHCVVNKSTQQIAMLAVDGKIISVH